MKKSRVLRPKHIFPKEKQFYDIVFRAMPCQYFSVPSFSVPGRAKIFRAMIFRAVPCHKSPGPPFRAVPGHPCIAVPCLFWQGRPVPCRAQIWWIHAVPNISAPCPHDPCPEIWVPFLWEKKGACGNVPTSSGLPEIWVPFLWEKKGACGNVPTSSGLSEICPP